MAREARDRATTRHDCRHGHLGAQCDAIPIVPTIVAVVIPPRPSSPTRRGPCSRRRRWSLTKVAGTTTMSMRAAAVRRSRPHQATHRQPWCGGWLRPWRPWRGGSRVSHGGSGRPRRSDWRLATLTTATTTQRRSGLVWRAVAAGGLRDPTGSGRLRPRRPRRDGDRVSRGGGGRPRRSGWRRAASTTAATASTTAARHQWLSARI
jgi:hypothetical protein